MTPWTLSAVLQSLCHWSNSCFQMVLCRARFSATSDFRVAGNWDSERLAPRFFVGVTMVVRQLQPTIQHGEHVGRLCQSTIFKSYSNLFHENAERNADSLPADLCADGLKLPAVCNICINILGVFSECAEPSAILVHLVVCGKHNVDCSSFR